MIRARTMSLTRLLLLFFVSGSCGLIYQVVWMRALTLTLSVTVYAVATVLCSVKIEPRATESMSNVEFRMKSWS